MSTAYNQRRGARANAARKPRECFAEGCIRYATIGNWCSDHCSLPATEGPIGRQLRLAHQANQMREDALLPMTCRRKYSRAQSGVKLSGAQKVMWRKLRATAAVQTFLQALVGVTFAEKVKSVAKKLNPWAK